MAEQQQTQNTSEQSIKRPVLMAKDHVWNLVAADIFRNPRPTRRERSVHACTTTAGLFQLVCPITKNHSIYFFLQHKTSSRGSKIYG